MYLYCNDRQYLAPAHCTYHPWKGPFIVMDKLGDTTYKIKPIHNGGRWQFVHFDRLKPCTRTMEEVDLHSPEEGAGERLQETLTTPPTVHAPAAEGNDTRSIGFDDILVSCDEDGAPVAGEQEPDEAIETSDVIPLGTAAFPNVTAHMSNTEEEEISVTIVKNWRLPSD